MLIGAAGLAACGGPAGLDRLSAGEQGRVKEVRSGDVIVLDSGLVVRLAGIEAPWAGSPGADAARADLARLVQGREVQLLYGGARRDAYGRALAQVRLTGGRTWVQGALLLDGQARVRTWADNRAMAQPMLEDEARARIKRRGLWALPVDQVLLPREVTPVMTGFQIVEGRIARVTQARSGLYLDFDDDRRGFAVQIAPAAERDFETAGMGAAGLASRLVRVRGPIGWNGLMRLDHPEQLELLKQR
jgi:endonuclease YncB( thermonuclease family)